MLVFLRRVSSPNWYLNVLSSPRAECHFVEVFLQAMPRAERHIVDFLLLLILLLSRRLNGIKLSVLVHMVLLALHSDRLQSIKSGLVLLLLLLLHLHHFGLIDAGQISLIRLVLLELHLIGSGRHQWVTTWRLVLLLFACFFRRQLWHVLRGHICQVLFVQLVVGCCADSMLRARDSDAVLLVSHGDKALDEVARTAIVAAVVVIVVGFNIVVDFLVEDLNQVVVVFIDLFYV